MKSVFLDFIPIFDVLKKTSDIGHFDFPGAWGAAIKYIIFSSLAVLPWIPVLKK